MHYPNPAQLGGVVTHFRVNNNAPLNILKMYVEGSLMQNIVNIMKYYET